MEKRMSSSSQLNAIQEKTWDYLKTFGNKDHEKAYQLIKKLAEEAKIKETTAIMVLNICPKDIPFLISIVSSLPEEKENIIDENNAKKILDIISDFCSDNR